MAPLQESKIPFKTAFQVYHFQTFPVFHPVCFSQSVLRWIVKVDYQGAKSFIFFILLKCSTQLKIDLLYRSLQGLRSCIKMVCDILIQDLICRTGCCWKAQHAPVWELAGLCRDGAAWGIKHMKCSHGRATCGIWVVKQNTVIAGQEWTSFFKNTCTQQDQSKSQVPGTKTTNPSNGGCRVCVTKSHGGGGGGHLKEPGFPTLSDVTWWTSNCAWHWTSQDWNVYFWQEHREKQSCCLSSE